MNKYIKLNGCMELHFSPYRLILSFNAMIAPYDKIYIADNFFIIPYNPNDKR